MPETQNRSFQSDIWILYLSRFFERSAYYGFRSVLLLFLLDAILFDQTKSMEYYGYLTLTVYIAYFVGGFIGDFLFKSKNTLILGSLIQALSIALIYFSSKEIVLFNLLFFALGTGLYSPNVLSLFGKYHGNRKNTLTSGFTLFYLFVNLGSMLGVIVVGFIHVKYGFAASFAISGLFSLIGGGLLFFMKGKPSIETPSEYNYKQSWAPIKVIFACFLSALFWITYEFAGSHVALITYNLSSSLNSSILTGFLTELPLLSFLPISLGIYFILRFRKVSYSFLLFLGFLFAALSFLILFSIPEKVMSNHLFHFYSYAFIIAMAEILIVPVLLSIISNFSNPRYLGIIFGAFLLSGVLINKILFYTYKLIMGKESVPSLLVIISCLLAISGVLYLYFYLSKGKKNTIDNTHSNQAF